jgi:hypothetical protein
MTAACCSSLGAAAGRSMQRQQSGGSCRLTPPTWGFPEESKYEGGSRGACNVSEALAGAGPGAHAADNAREASPVPPAPAKSNRILFPEDNFTTGPANAEIVHPPPALSTNNTRITAHCEAWFFEASPAQGTGIASFVTRGLLAGAVSLQGNNRGDRTSVRIMAGL